MAREVFEADQDFKSLYNKLTDVSENTQKTFLGNVIYALGAPPKYKPPISELLAISEFLSQALIVPEVLKFTRIRISADEIHSTKYKHITARNGNTVAYKSQLGHILFGKIMYFCQLLDDHMENANLVILESLPRIQDIHLYQDWNTSACAKHITAINATEQPKSLCVVHISDILHKVVYTPDASSRDLAFVVPFPNICQKD